MPPCLRVSCPKISVCSHLLFQVRYIFPISKLYLYFCHPLLGPPPSQSLKSTQRVARTLYTQPSPLKRWPRQQNLPLILPSQHPKPASKFVASTRPWYCRLPPYIQKYYSFETQRSSHFLPPPIPLPPSNPTRPTQPPPLAPLNPIPNVHTLP